MKYIDAEKLIGKIEKSKNELKSLMSKLYYAANYKEWEAELNGYNKILSIITSLQQEQSDFPTTDEEIEMLLATLPKVEIPNKYKTPDWLWRKPKQPEVDIVTEYDEQFDSDPVYGKLANRNAGIVIARHFYELGINTRERDEHERLEVDLEKEIEMYISSKGLKDYAFLVPSIARHFWNKGYNTRKEE